MDLCAKEDLQAPGLHDVELKSAAMGEFDSMEDLHASSPGSPKPSCGLVEARARSAYAGHIPSGCRRRLTITRRSSARSSREDIGGIVALGASILV